MNDKIAYLFPGQGSQALGMGLDLLDDFPETRELFEAVDDICRKPISKLCFEGPMEKLTLTVNLQPAITAVNLACLAVLNRSGIQPTISAGHSLGEFAAMAASGVISAIDALSLTKKRGELMHREALGNPGTMAALIGLDIKAVDLIVGQAKEDGILAVANHNTAEQIVITGEEAPVSRAMSIAKEKGARAVPLMVSGAWHCDLMKDAVDEFRGFMEAIPFSAPKTTMLFNATAENETDPEKIKDTMAKQLISSVRWYDIIQRALDEGVETFVEVGPKNVLAGLLKKIVPREKQVKVFGVGKAEGLHQFLKSRAEGSD